MLNEESFEIPFELDFVETKPVTVEDAVEAGSYLGFADISAEIYHSSPYWSNSILKEVKRSPAHAVALKATPRKPTKSQDFGTLFHVASLEPERFEKDYGIEPNLSDYPGFLKTTDDMKAKLSEMGLKVSGSRDDLKKRLKEADPTIRFWHELVEEMTRGKQLLDQETMDQIRFMRDAVFKHPFAKTLLLNGKSELSAFWEDTQTNVKMKARFDYVRLNEEIIVDVKTSEDASFDAFQKSVYNYGYHIQSAIYLDAFNHLRRTKTNEFLHVVVEKEPPYAVSVYLLDDATIEKGREVYRHALAKVAHCEQTGHWPAYSDDVQIMNLPHWAWNKEE